MHFGMPECHKLFLGHCDLDLWPSFQEWLCPEHICYIIWCRNPKFGVVIPLSLGMAEWCIPFWVTLTLTFTSGLISRFFVLYYSYLSSNVSYARPIPFGAFVTCLWHYLFLYTLLLLCPLVPLFSLYSLLVLPFSLYSLLVLPFSLYSLLLSVLLFSPSIYISCCCFVLLFLSSLYIPCLFSPSLYIPCCCFVLLFSSTLYIPCCCFVLLFPFSLYSLLLHCPLVILFS